MLVDFHWTTQCYIAEDRNLQIIISPNIHTIIFFFCGRTKFETAVLIELLPGSPAQMTGHNFSPSFWVMHEENCVENWQIVAPALKEGRRGEGTLTKAPN
jgi:hypothetical protein